MFDIFTNPKRQKSLLVYLILAMICIVFVFMSDANFGNNGAQGGYAATVNDSIISINELKSATEQVIRMNSMFYGKDFGSSLEQRQQASMQALQSLVSQELIAQAATKSGLLVTNEELANTIMTLPYFQQNGVFSKDAYDYFLQSQRMSAGQFEGQLRKEIANSKVNDLFRMSLVKSDLQKQKEEAASSVLMQVKYIGINKDLLSTSVKVSDAEVEKVVSDKSLEATLKEQFALNQKSYNQEESVKVRHILILPEENKWDAAKETADKVKAETTVANFAAQAKKYSGDEATKESGGDLGYVSKGAMVKEFEDVAFQLSKGSISAPVKTQFGYHIIYAEDKKAAKTANFEDVKKTVAERWLKQKQIEDMVKALDTNLKEGKHKEAESVLAALQLKWVDSPKFDLSAENLGPLGQINGFVEESLSLSPAKPYVNRVLQNNNNYYVIKYLSKESGKKPDVIKADLAQNNSGDFAIRSWLKGLRENAKIVANPTALQ
jgi:peptidyl-prolyl cis-trans isomerase D